MRRITTDVAVIGAGTAGIAAYRAARVAGRRVVMIEGGAYGTTCARVGCMPSKLLIAAADAAHVTSKWPAFGIRLEGSVRIDGRAVMMRVKRERDRFVNFVLEGIASIPDQDKLRGYAKFVDDHTLQVDDAHVDFARAVIATGSSAVIPAPLTELGERLIVSDDIFDWDDLPHSVAVFGPGVIGLELGQALHRLGVKVLIFGRGGLLGPLSDPALHAYAIKAFQAELYLDPNVNLLDVQRVTDGVRLRYLDLDGKHAEATVERVVAASGRTPNVRHLGLENTSLKLQANGVPEFNPRTMQCGASSIFIAGDVDNHRPVLHEAADEGRIAGENAARYPAVAAELRRAPLAVVFSDPQLAVIGTRYRDLTPGQFVVGEVSFEDQGRSAIMLRNKGLLHVYADIDSGRLLGAEMIAPDAEHLGHLLAWSLQAKLTIAEMLDMPFYHPVVEEGLRTALRDAKTKLIGIYTQRPKFVAALS